LAENLALDESLLLTREGSREPELLRIWEWQSPAVVVGAGGSIRQDVNEAQCQRDGVPIQRRASGGGTVVLASGCLCYSLVLSYERSGALEQIGTSYVYVLERVRAGLADLCSGARFAGTSDLAIGGRKFSGNAQQRKRTHLLHHGTLLYNFDIGLAGRYLRLPGRQPAYRQQRVHADFLVNLPATSEELIRRLRRAWGAHAELTDWPRETVRQLVQEKYSTQEWIRRR
jgi:lipoate-protein ligase A